MASDGPTDLDPVTAPIGGSVRFANVEAESPGVTDRLAGMKAPADSEQLIAARASSTVHADHPVRGRVLSGNEPLPEDPGGPEEDPPMR